MEVEQHEIHRARRQDLERLGGTVRHARQLESRDALDVGGVHLRDKRVVLDHQRADHGPPTFTATGTRTVNTAPPSLRASTDPPSRSAVAPTSARPSPRRPATPPAFVDQPASKIRDNASADMPGPSSRTSIITASPSASSRTPIRPPRRSASASSALSTRLPTIVTRSSEATA